MQDGINSNAGYKFNTNYNNYKYMYYTNSTAKTQLESWYQANIGSNENLSSKVATGNYYCEQAKVKVIATNSDGTAGMVVYDKYTPNFQCATDENGKGVVSASVGLLNYDEIVYAGGYTLQRNSNYYLYNNYFIWSMSPNYAKTSYDDYGVWAIDSPGYIGHRSPTYALTFRPVINLKSDTKISDGDGTKDNPYVVQ